MREDVMVSVFCLLVVIGALAAAGWALFTGQVFEQGIDGLFLLVVCLGIAAAFCAPLAGPAKKLMQRKKAAAAAPAPQDVPKAKEQPAGREVA